MNIFIDHVGDGHKHYRMAITSVLYNECLRRRCLTKKGNVAQVEFYNIDNASMGDDKSRPTALKARPKKLADFRT